MHTTDIAPTSWTGLPDLRPQIVGFLGRFLRDDAEIEDVAQETLLRAARFRLRLADAGRLRPWVLRIALNVLRDRRRREGRLPRGVGDDLLLDGLEGREEIPGETREDTWIELAGVRVERASAFKHLGAALGGLPAGDRGALAGWYLDPAGCAGAGEVCEPAQSLAPKQRVHRARRRLLRALLQRLERDPGLAWPELTAPTKRPRPVGGARCARARTGSELRTGRDRAQETRHEDPTRPRAGSARPDLSVDGPPGTRPRACNGWR
ncbi:MAG: hypothetical protein JNK02_10795 [Planctomycetes bacterium]|nr:hypothetical protein [Planctomycetota bacterium]